MADLYDRPAGQSGFANSYYFTWMSLVQPQDVAWEGNNMDIEDIKQEREFVEYGNALDNEGKYEQAVAAYDSALAIVPEDADVLYDKGETLVKLGMVPEAMKCFETATQMYVSGLG
jgi:tetratricopeptide (TPR) repeat protein